MLALIPNVITLAVVLIKVGRWQQSLQDLSAAQIKFEREVNQKLDNIAREMLRKELFESEMRNVTDRVERLEVRTGELERAVFRRPGA